MVMNEAVPRLSAGPFSGIMGILESAAIECLSINVEPITIEKLSSESLYSRKGGRILLFIAGLRQKRKCSTGRVFSGIAYLGPENRATLQTSAEEREKCVSLHQENSLFLRVQSFSGS
ncbi:MAG: hypothetical protein D8B51_06495 [Tannerella sp.]|nr:MAG: hypothetical protein D8B51_06495 [Tannerella sp.]